MRLSFLAMTTVCFLLPLPALADEICAANKDTSLFADAPMTQEDRMVFQFDGVQFVPERKEGDTMFGMAYDVQMQQLLEKQSYVRAADWVCEDLPQFKASDAGTNEAEANIAPDVMSYDVSAEACLLELSDTRFEISQQSFSFYESACDIKDATAQGAATAYTLSCYGGGDTWDIQALLSPASGNGVNLSVDGNSTTYVACSK
jgi:hypothetical protein